jgi:hypothetical protein
MVKEIARLDDEMSSFPRGCGDICMSNVFLSPVLPFESMYVSKSFEVKRANEIVN